MILPLSAQIAKRIYTGPVSSVPSERSFSAGGLVVTPKKNRLAPKKVENLVLIKLNKDRIENFKRNSGYSIKKNENVIPTSDGGNDDASQLLEDDLHYDM